jgi:hypothetical protein
MGHEGEYIICVFSEQDVDVKILAPKFVSPTLDCSPSGNYVLLHYLAGFPSTQQMD